MNKFDSSIPSWKKAMLALGVAGALSGFTAGWLEKTDTKSFVESNPGSAFSEFIQSAKDQSVNAFGNFSLKQASLNSIHSLMLFLENRQIKPGTFDTNPQAYADWVMNTAAPYGSERVDLSNPNHQQKTIDDISEKIFESVQSINAYRAAQSDLLKAQGKPDVSENQLIEVSIDEIKSALTSSIGDSLLVGYSEHGNVHHDRRSFERSFLAPQPRVL